MKTGPVLLTGTEGAENVVGFGRDLQQQRISRGVELEAIAASTRVSIRHLRALEDERRSDLPGGVFNKGILRGYCEVVGLEEREWLDRFATSDLNTSTEPDWSAFAENVKQHRLVSVSGRGNRRWFGVLLMIVGLVALGWVAWHFTVRPHLVMRNSPEPVTNSEASQGKPLSPIPHDSV
jgi:cytoskeletal protein RodZ